MDTFSLLSFVLAGLGGGVVYSYYNKLFSVATYLQAVEHAAAGAIVGGLAAFGVVGSGFAVPTDWTTALPVAILGYAGTDVLDTLFQKLKPPAPATAA